MSSARSVIVLVIDRLGAGYLGPYGNTWLETPAFNQLASQSLLCEQLLANSPDLAKTYQSYWQSPELGEKSLPQQAAAAGCHSVLLTDEEAVAGSETASEFDEIHLLPLERPSAPAAEVEETAFLHLMDAALEQLESWKQAKQPQFLWIHARAMNGPWDAPLELRQQFAGEEDPLPSESVDPPEEMLAKDHDPDAVLSLAHAYAGQVSVIDIGLQLLLNAIDELPQRDDLLLLVTSPRGYPLGEHLRVGECDQALYSELLHVPCLLRFPQTEGALIRTQELIQPTDLKSTLADAAGWVDNDPIRAISLLRTVRGEESIRRDVVLATAANQQVIRTAAWQLRVIQQNGDEDLCELYAKPDDRWEFNNVASRAAAIVQQLKELAQQPWIGELPSELTSPWR